MTLQIIIPCAGEGRRFREAGYLIPKPFMDVAGKSMIARVMESLTPTCPHTFQLLDRAMVGQTEGAVDTLLRADIDPDSPVLVANCDQWIAPGVIGSFLYQAERSDVAIMTFTSDNPHHSYVTVNEYGDVMAIREKEVISDNAVVGVYWFRTGALLTDYASKVITNNRRVKGEFYVSSMLDLMIGDDVRVSMVPFDSHQVAMLGTPEELSAYLETL